MQPAKKPFHIFNLRETYAELGTFEFKVVLDQRHFKNGHLSEVEVFDSDRKPLKIDVKKWGRKINCSFVIDGDVADGIGSIVLHLKDDSDRTWSGVSHFWVVK